MIGIPGPSYDYDYGYNMAVEDTVGVILVVVLAVMLIMLAIAAVVYVLQAWSLYSIAKRRGIHNPWLAWIPVGDMWILGSISDQYQYLVKEKNTSRRKVLLGLVIAVYALMMLYYISQFATLIGAIAGGGEEMVGATAVGTLLLSLVMLVVSVVASVVASVFQYISIFDMFRSCDPDNAVLYLVLSILFPISLPVFYMVCRKKDLGMPPKKAPQPVQPVIPQPVVIPAPVPDAPVPEETATPEATEE